ncbi:MAG: LOG family protein, partial [Pseudonocardiaceae bacterium]
CLPGGFGTLDELFEALTLVQNKKVTKFPVVLLGRAYWGGLHSWLADTVVAQGKITEAELALLHVTDDVDEVVRLVGASYQAWQDAH